MKAALFFTSALGQCLFEKWIPDSQITISPDQIDAKCLADLVSQNHINKAKEIAPLVTSDQLVPLISASALAVNERLEKMLEKVTAKK